MLTDPQSVTYNAGSVSLPSMSRTGRVSQYVAADGSLTLDVAHTNRANRTQSLIKLTHKKITADPLVPANNRPYNLSVHLVVNRPLDAGYTNTEAQLVYDALVALVGNATFKGKILGGES
jgi:hypothetical protein